jgi:hypothetical protein
VIPLRISVHQVKDWVKELHAIVGAGIILVIAGNKADLERSRVVKTETADAYVAVLARFFSFADPSVARFDGIQVRENSRCVTFSDIRQSKQGD